MEYTMNDYFFGYDQYEDLPATESFVSFNEELFPATEGLKDTVKKAATAVKGFIIRCANHLLSLLLKLARLIVNAIPHRETKERLKAKLTISINKCKDRIEKYKKNPSPTDNDAKQIVSEIKQATSIVASAKNEVQDPEVKKEIVKTVKEMDQVSKEITNNKNTTEDSNNGKKIYYREDGKTISGIIEPNGKETWYDKDGKTISLIIEPNGKKIYYDKDGKTIIGIKEPNGKEMEYREDGKTLWYIKEPNGKETTYRLDGKTIWYIIEPNGKEIEYHEDGKTIMRIKEPNGKNTYYDKDGKKIGEV